MRSALIAGFATSAGLIIAIGAQNAYVLRQGMARHYVGMVALVCALSDAILISAGIGGLGTIVQRHRGLLNVVAGVGVAYLFFVGAKSLLAARSPEQLDPDHSALGSRRSVLLAVLGFTFLNPHVYLDTVLLLGGLGATYGANRWWFAIGAIAASATWFSSLAFAGRGLSRFMSSPVSWRIMDLIIGAVMWAVAISIAVETFA